MSRYGDSDSGIRKESMYEELENYIKENGLGDLIGLIADIIDDNEIGEGGDS